MEYFDNNTDNINIIKNYIKYQGYDICKSQIGKEYITEILNNMTFGFIYYNKITEYGRFKRKKKEYYVYSFILCSYNNDFPDDLEIKLICSRNKDGSELIKIVEEKAKDMNIKRLNLFSLPQEKLKNWYIKQGFNIKNKVFYYNEKGLKGFEMYKKIN